MWCYGTKPLDLFMLSVCPFISFLNFLSSSLTVSVCVFISYVFFLSLRRVFKDEAMGSTDPKLVGPALQLFSVLFGYILDTFPLSFSFKPSVTSIFHGLFPVKAAYCDLR